jgi:ribose/xylose/arabinose/galactoside ABC-type transport system permease subunit
VLVILAILVTGAAVGAANAFVIARLGINNPIIVTLGMLSVVHGGIKARGYDPPVGLGGGHDQISMSSGGKVWVRVRSLP